LAVLPSSLAAFKISKRNFLKSPEVSEATSASKSRLYSESLKKKKKGLLLRFHLSRGEERIQTFLIDGLDFFELSVASVAQNLNQAPFVSPESLFEFEQIICIFWHEGNGSKLQSQN